MGLLLNATFLNSLGTLTIIDCVFSSGQRTAHCNTVKRNQKPTKMGEYAKITNIL